MRILLSAFRHGCREEDIAYAWENFVVEFLEREDPPKSIRLGMDRSGRMLEIGGVVTDTGEVLIIHAMRARPRYTRRLRWMD
jgi:hypothetical protein